MKQTKKVKKIKAMKKEKTLKLKKGDLVRVDPPMLGQIIGIRKGFGYRIKVFASADSEVSYYGDDEVYKVSKKSEWVKSVLTFTPPNKSK